MITIIDYNSGNIASVKNALTKLGFDYEVSCDPLVISKSEKVIFPGVGRASYAMKQLAKSGLIKTTKSLKVPFLGICLGLQLLSEFSEEGDTTCLGVIPGQVKKFPNSVKIPQIGWNKVSTQADTAILANIPDDSYFYFVNSYYFDCASQYALAETSYGLQFPSIIQKDNFYATQFHPEKSGEIGLKLLDNFCKL